MVLRGEPRIENAHGDARALGDIGDADALEVPFVEQGPRRVDEAREQILRALLARLANDESGIGLRTSHG